MAAKVWYMVPSVLAGLVTTSPGAEAYASGPTGWIVSTGAGPDYSSLAMGGERAATTFGATVQPDGSLDIVNGDFFVSEAAYTGTFAAANWTIDFAVRAQTGGGAHDGNAGFRLFRMSSSDGAGTNVEITAGVQVGSTVTNLATSATQKSSVTFNPGSFSVTNEFIGIQVGWKRTGAGAMTSDDVNLRVGTGASVVTSSDFSLGATTHATTGALTGPGAVIAGTAAHIAIHGTSGALTGPGSTIAGTASSATPRPSSGALVGPGSVVAGTAARTHVFPTSGDLVGPGAVIAGSAARTAPAGTTHATSGDLVGPGSVIAGTAAHVAVHGTSGALTGQGSVVAGTASLTSANPVVVSSPDVGKPKPWKQKWRQDLIDALAEAQAVAQETQPVIEGKRPQKKQKALEALRDDTDAIQLMRAELDRLLQYRPEETPREVKRMVKTLGEYLREAVDEDDDEVIALLMH